MKLDARQIAGFLRDPGRARLALIFGDDDGLIRERAQALTRAVAGSLDDPFLVTELTRESWANLPAEMAALSLAGGCRVIQVRDATDAILPFVTQAMRGSGPAMLILEAAGLPKGKLRSFAETSADCVAFACYVEEGRAAAASIRLLLQEWVITADDEVVDWLSHVLEPGRAAMRGELEKLALFTGSPGRLTHEDAETALGVAAAGAGGDGVLAAALGDRPGADHAIEVAIADGLNGVAVMRMVLSLLQRLHQARLRVDAGASLADAVKLMRPPVFFRAAPQMTAALRSWSSDRLMRCLEQARQVELDCKQTASRPELLARRFIAEMARQARSR